MAKYSKKEVIVMRIDMHTHSEEGSDCSNIPVKSLVEMAGIKGLDGILITDHESDAGYKAYREQSDLHPGIVVLRGFEVLTRYGDMLVILPLDQTILDLAEVLSQSIQPEDLIQIVHERRGAIGVAHPFREYSIGCSIKNEERLLRVLESLDFIEVENGGATKEENERANYWATKLNKVKISGSDCHRANDIGKCFTMFDKSISNEMELISALIGK